MKSMLKICSICLLSLPLIASDWPTFRGPDRTGTTNRGLLDQSFGFKVDWKKPLGSGYSSLSIVGDTFVTMYTDGKDDIIAAYSAESGEERWRHVMGPMYKGHSGSHDGPTGSPVIDGDMVFGIDTGGFMVALSLATGEKKWGFKLGEDVPARVPHYGFNTVPLIMGDKVIVMTGEKGRAVTAFERNTGKEIWSSGDDTTTYQSPYLWERGGKKHLLLVTDNYLMEMDPADGRVIWQGEHKILDNETYALPVFIDDNTILIQDRHQVASFRLSWEGEKATMEEVWRNKVFQRTYAIPVVKDGYLYGFRSQFLHCVKADTGEVVWRSRPPGGKGLTLLDGNLLIMGNDGDLVAVKATHEGYQELARETVFDQDTYTPVSVAGQHLYVRNRKEMARVSITDASASPVAAATKMPELEGAFGKWVGELMKASDQQAQVDAYLAKQKSFPIIEEGGLVHFVYNGEIEDIAVALAGEQEKPMFNVPGTNLHFVSQTLDEGGHWMYSFSSYGDRMKDPLNKHVIDRANELRMPKWRAPDFFGEPTGERGKLEEITLTVGEKERKAKVYTPAGYANSDTRYPTLYIPAWQNLDEGKLDVALDNLIAGKRMAPIIAVFVDMPRAEARNPDVWIKDLVETMIPHVDKTFRTKADAAHRGMAASALGAVNTAYTTTIYPDTFGKIALQSFLFFGDAGKKVKEKYADGPLPGDVYLVISSKDYDFPGHNAEAHMKEVHATLKEKGSKVTMHTNAGSPSWGNWRAQYDRIFGWFAPN